jgi:serine/threonine-protein kinase
MTSADRRPLGTTPPGAPNRVVHRALTAHLSGKGLDEEDRAFLQHRLGLFCLTTFLLSFGFLLFSQAVTIFRGAAGRDPESQLAHVAATAVAGLMWLLCRGPKRSAAVLSALDLGVAVFLGGAFATMCWFLPRHVTSIFPMILAMTHICVARAVIVPSSGPRTFLISLVAQAPVAVTAVVLALASAAQMSADPIGYTFALGAGPSWGLATVATSTFCSSVIWGLQRKVDEAEQLGQYTLAEKIGEGGMGVVYRAHHAMLRRPTAVKLLRPDDAGEANLVRFEREVQLTSKLTHPNTIAIFDYGRTADGVFYYAMELLDGLTLEELVSAHGPLSAARTIHVLRQMCGALAEAHSIGLIHRDVKPANVVLCERGGAADVVKVVDFGLVKDLGDDAGVTQANTLAGTPLYMSPEAVRDPATIDARSDLYAVGAVAYYLLTGKDVFEGATILEVCSHHLRSTPVAPSERSGRDLPDDLESLVLSCLEKDPAARPKDARTLGAALARCGDAGGWTEEEATTWWRAHKKSRAPRVVDPLAETVARSRNVLKASGDRRRAG